jgi:type I R/M system specificity subunit
MTKKPSYRFVDYDEPWEEKKLGNLGSVEMCRRIFKEETSAEFEIPFFKIGTFGGEADTYITREKFEEYKTKFAYPKRGDLLLSASGSIGRVVEYDGDEAYYQDSNIVWLNHHGKINNKFLKAFYEIVSWSGIEGTTIKRLYNKNILETDISLPSLPEQTAIGSFFQDIDQLISLQQRKLEVLKEQKKTYLKLLFPFRGKTKPALRFAGFEDDWKEVKLGEIADYKNGKGYEDRQSDSGSYELINLNSISIDGGLKRSGKFIDKADETLEKGDLVMVLSDVAHGNLLGRVAIIPESNKFVLNQRVALLRPRLNSNSEFLYSYINSNQYYFKAQGAGMSQLNISRSSVENFSVYFPTLPEQEAIGSFFQDLDKAIAKQEEKVSQLKESKQTLLRKMFI